MMSNPHEMFKGFESYRIWDNYVLQCDAIEELTPEQRRDACEAISHLREVFGEDFLHKAFTDHPILGHPVPTHPLTRPLMDAAPRHKLWLIHFVAALKTLSGAANFGGLLDRLRDPEEYAEGMTVLEVGYKFSQSGFAVDFDPSVEVRNSYGGSRAKVPDLKITDRETAEEIIVEVSRLRTSEQQHQTSRTYDVFFNLLHRHPWTTHMLSYARVTQTLDEDELMEAVERVKTLIEEARSSGQFHELTVEGVFEVGVAPEAEWERVRTWAAERGIKDTLEGPVIPLNEVWRARGKLRKELKQLPDDRPGIIVLPAHENLLFFTYDIRHIIAELAEEVRRHPKLLCAVLLHNFVAGGDEDAVIAEAGRHTLIHKIRVDWSTEQTLIVVNESCAHRLSDVTTEKVEDAFVQF